MVVLYQFVHLKMLEITMQETGMRDRGEKTNQRKSSKEGSRARTASGPGRWRFILYVCKTHGDCVTHTHAPRLQ